MQRGADVVHLDDEKTVEDLHHDSDEHDEADGGQKETIPIFTGPR